jgi:CHASE3 domain sensor protein
MKTLTAENKLMAYLAAILFVTVMLGVVSYGALSRINRKFGTAVHSTTRKLRLAGEINVATDEMLAAQRSIRLYANTPEGDENQRIFELRSAQIDGDGDELTRLSGDGEELKTIALVKQSNASYRTVVEQMG